MNGQNFCVVDNILNYTELYIGPTRYCVEDLLSCDLDGTLGFIQIKTALELWKPSH